MLMQLAPTLCPMMQLPLLIFSIFLVITIVGKLITRLLLAESLITDDLPVLSWLQSELAEGGLIVGDVLLVFYKLAK